MKFTVLIPTHNEEKRISKTLDALKNYGVVVVDDGSDSTAKIARRKGARVIHFKQRQGKGGAVMHGIRASKTRFVLLYDADAATPPSQIPKITREKADVVVGTRYNAKSKTNIKLHRLIAGKTFNFLARLLFGLNVSDTQCGFKLFDKKTIEPLLDECVETGFVWDVEILYRAKKAGLSIKELPIEWREVAGGVPQAEGLVKTALRMWASLFSLRKKISAAKTKQNKQRRATRTRRKR
ncbi:hypothetical protein COX85_02300 [Candidatus Micrarchaeota archaeon CG_4_10_14_0_2_um_filter_55_9]|nr:MAG: hypothetical protein AUJ15_03395 [Candidatus Micrarchaeota archaeon CG1_02_55_41]PIO02804.1 MAG: hypothetical protein COT57_02215 [Candidatus Micrarchaeota archaeon CG09_land_8_20_14_0_10_55_25]PIZ91735.1 MAG: hypothetical protein COX85_02300 [Candidatus Micrarchaeota archaeon CG_4_10_14_0_2_um_filter_55_9]PJD01421.1 MAG: hypothetical protein COU38_01005 [Candidatus Micrarchaeota archaeon CG10_big_fil_rev_8_21_14_0_10_54_18]